MASVMKCDRCGEMGEPSRFMHIRAYELVSATTHARETKKHMDVCKKCYKKIFKESEDK